MILMKNFISLMMNRWILFIFLSVNILIAFYFWRYWKIIKEVKDIKKEGLLHSTKSDVFIPTNEWQKINRDQAIPSGLHVRINLQTGEREAKLMSSESKEKKYDDETFTVKLENISTDKGVIIDNDNLRIHQGTDSLRKMSKDVEDEDEFKAHDDSTTKKFRTYEELKKDMSELQLNMKTDVEVMNELTQKFKKVQADTTLSDLQKENEIVSILNDFEYLLHQVDNARDFVKNNGISEIIAPCLLSNSTISRTLAARVLGSAAQNNAKVQIAALKAGLIKPLLKNIVLEKGYEIRSSSLYAISCLTRSFPLAEIKLIEEGGLSVLLSLFDEDSVDALKLQLKVVTLFDDLLFEREDAQLMVEESKLLQNVTEEVAIEEAKMMVEKLKQYNNVGLASKLVEKGWCLKLVQFLTSRVFESNLEGAMIDDTSVNHDVADKVTNAMLSVSGPCESQFKSEKTLHSVLKSLLNYYKNLPKSDEENTLYSDIFSTLHKLVTKLKIE